MGDKDLRLQVVLSAVDKITRPFKAMKLSKRTLGSVVKSAKDQLKQLERQSGPLQGFVKTKQPGAQVADALRAARDPGHPSGARHEKHRRPHCPPWQKISVGQRRRHAIAGEVRSVADIAKDSAHRPATKWHGPPSTGRRQHTLKPRAAEANICLAAQQ